MVISFLFGGFLVYSTGLSDQSTSQYLVPVMCILSIQETFGMTLAISYGMVVALIPLSIFLYVIQKIGLGYQDYLAGELLLLASSLFIGYKCSQVTTRKIALLINAIFFATIINQPDVPSSFAFTLLEAFVLGIAISIVVSMLVFPMLATFDIENRFNYCLTNLNEMESITIQAFLCEDKMSAQVSLTRVSTIEQMVRTAMNLMHLRINEALMEPSRLLQRVFNRKRRHLIDLRLQEQIDLTTALMFHVCSLQLMVKQCQFNEYHSHFAVKLRASLLHLSTCQTRVISRLMSWSSINRDEFNSQLVELQKALCQLRTDFIEARLRQVEYALQNAMIIQSEDHLSHTFFLFQLDAIVQQLMQAAKVDSSKSFYQEMKDMFTKRHKTKRRTVKEILRPQWPRFASAFKSMVIIGVGSVFVMVPRLSATFENGQWILIALCMTQGDTVGGAFTTMKMRLVGTLLGAMWAYVTYLSVNDNVYHTIGMLVPWILIFGYLKLRPSWGYAATVAAFTPPLINLGRIPYGDSVPAGNYALLRIEENLVGIAIASILTIIIFPLFAIDVLKSNISSTLQVCRESIESMNSIYYQLFEHDHSNFNDILIEQQTKKDIKSVTDAQRSRFHQLISSQRVLVSHAALEPTMWWSYNSFSSDRYLTLAQQQVDMFRMLHNIDSILLCINECINDDVSQVQYLQTKTAGSFFLPDLHTELTNLSRQLGDCVNLWASYFTLTQTRFYRIFRDFTYSRTTLTLNDLLKHERHLIELHHTVHRLQRQHQKSLNGILEHYLDRLAAGDSPSKIIPYIENEKADLIFIGISAMYYSTSQLARDALALGSNIHTIFELETSSLYRPF